MRSDPIVIVSSARTPLGNFQGELSSLTASQLGAIAIRAAVSRAGLDPELIDEVIMGNVLSAGQGQAPARQAAIGAGLSLATGCTTVNKMCGSGMKATMFAHDQLLAGVNQVMVAGGMESMSNSPYLIPKGRAGLRMGHSTVIDQMFLDGLEDAYEPGRLMGSFAEECAEKYHFSREAQDEFALASLARATSAASEGAFNAEIESVAVSSRSGESVVASDEAPRKASPEKISRLKPAFKAGGSVTAANSSSISDGAAALILTRASKAQSLGLQPVAKILGHATYANESKWFTTAPIGALDKLYALTGMGAQDFDLYEINEAFAVVTMAAMKSLDIPHERVNVHGGACALGHPIGATGARILVTLIAALQRNSLKRGAAALCIGGGEATAIGIELL
jgi:acetyl-CoA C-acetyltransferase